MFSLKTVVPFLAVIVFTFAFWDQNFPVLANHELGEKAAYKEQIHNGPLDGMVFNGKLGPDGKTLDVKDQFVFESGTFVSKECELQCDYPARPYFVREFEGKTEFISHTKCPYKEAEIVWHGVIEDDKISGAAIWTVKRWYWTLTSRYDFEGQLDSSATPLASAE